MVGVLEVGRLCKGKVGFECGWALSVEFGHLVNTRNANVMQSLDTLYRNKLAGNEVKVFAVSNTEYWEHRDLPKDEALSCLQLSGIFTIRKHCISMVANSQLRAGMKYILHDIPALLGDIELWVQSGARSVDAERKEAIRETLNTMESRLKRVRKDTLEISIGML